MTVALFDFQELEQFIVRHNATYLLNDFDLAHDFLVFLSIENPYFVPVGKFLVDVFESDTNLNESSKTYLLINIFFNVK